MKNGANLSLPIHAELRAALPAHLASLNEAHSESPLLFPTRAGRLDRSLEAKLRRVWKRSGIQNAHAHRFRDTFSAKLLAQGASLYDVARLLGNSVRVVERHYAPYVKELQDRWKFDRFARSVSHLLRALETFNSLGIAFVSLSEQLDTSTPAGKMVFTVLGAVAELERSLIAERVKAGLRNARAKGKTLGRPKVILEASRIAKLRAPGVGWKKISRELGVGVGTVLRIAHEDQESGSENPGSKHSRTPPRRPRLNLSGGSAIPAAFG